MLARQKKWSLKIFLKQNVLELDQEVGIKKKQKEASLHVHMLTHELQLHKETFNLEIPNCWSICRKPLSSTANYAAIPSSSSSSSSLPSSTDSIQQRWRAAIGETNIPVQSVKL
ncbi:hypothetical protein L1887_12710 [Cichorium endivia]|nr:hypothetical protein L1887_12710 [Cichorium endivia]